MSTWLAKKPLPKLWNRFNFGQGFLFDFDHILKMNNFFKKKKPFDSIDPYSIHIWTLDCIVTIEMHFYGSFTVLYPFSFCFHLLQNMDKVHRTVSCWIDSKGCDGHTWHVAVFSSRWSNLDKLLSTALLSISVRFIFYALIFQISN